MSEIIQCTYKGQPARVVTCLSREQADELRGRWPDGVVPIDRLHETPLLTNATSRAWLVQTVCKILKIEDWPAVVTECMGEGARALRPPHRPRRPLQLPKAAVAPTALAAERRPTRAERIRESRSR